MKGAQEDYYIVCWKEDRLTINDMDITLEQGKKYAGEVKIKE